MTTIFPFILFIEKADPDPHFPRLTQEQEDIGKDRAIFGVKLVFIP